MLSVYDVLRSDDPAKCLRCFPAIGVFVRDIGIEVLGRIELETHIDEPHYSHLVSIGNPISLFTINRPDTSMPRLFRSASRGFSGSLSMTWKRKVTCREDSSRKKFPGSLMFEGPFNSSKLQPHGQWVPLHCWQGVSRSAASPLGSLHDHRFEETAAMTLRNIRPELTPPGNREAVRLGAWMRSHGLHESFEKSGVRG